MKTIFLALLLILFMPSLSWGLWHLYLIPVELVSVDGEPIYTVLYLPEMKISYRAFHYGQQGQALVAADTDTTQDTAIKANTDVLAIPDNLSQQIGAGALATVQAAMEARGIPGQWLTATVTYRTLLRVAIGVFRLLQRYTAISNNPASFLFGSNVTLDTTFGQLPAQVRADLLATAKSLSLNTSGFTGASTIRQILKGIGDQMAGVQTILGGVTI